MHRAPDSEDGFTAGHGEGDGPPNINSKSLQELDEKAALDEVEKPFNMNVIQPVTLFEGAAMVKNVWTRPWCMTGGSESSGGFGGAG